MVCLLVSHNHEACKTAEPIKMPFGLWTWVGPRNHALDAVQIPPPEGSMLRGKKRPIVKYNNTLP